MIPQLASPSVLVIDDDENEYGHIGQALNELFVSFVLLTGAIDQLPKEPFTRVQLVFLDLHLTSSLGKTAASNTANVFRKVVSANTAPVVVVIWSKYADDKVAQADVPSDDQETESGLFKRTLFEAEPRFKNRLIFLEMDKPKGDRPPDWSNKLQEQIKSALGDQSAIGLLWTWDSLVKDANAALIASLTDLAEESAGEPDPELEDGDLKEVLQCLAKAHGEGDLSAATAPGHLVAILSQLLMDQLEHAGGRAALAVDGVWLGQPPGNRTNASVRAKMNGFLLTAEHSAAASPFWPGTVYAATDIQQFFAAFSITQEQLERIFCQTKRTEANAAQLDEWFNAVRLVMLEISPACDVAQGKRYNAHLVGGLVVPSAKVPRTKLSGDPLTVLPPSTNPTLALRWNLEGFNTNEVKLVFHHGLKTTLSAATEPTWCSPWFRLRELPTTAVRNPHMSHGSRVGYVSIA
jgi:hypothetical protein